MKNSKINGYPLNKILDAITLLQQAGLDTSSTSMHLTMLIGKEEDKKCEHNWVLDGHNAGDSICSKCYTR